MTKLDHGIALGLLPNELIVDNFAGGGGASLGIGMALGRSPDIAINHDPEAIAMHAANHPETKHYCEDVWHVDPVEACDGRPVGLAWFSPDCFPAGTLILTDRGYRPIEQVEIGDLVLTHRGRWQHVTDVMTSRKPTRVIRTHGHPGLRVSDEHPFYARRGKTGPIEWVRAGDIERGHYVASPTDFSDLPPPKLPECEGLWWIVGKYLAEGWTRIREQNAEMTLTVGKHEAAEIGQLLEEKTDLRWSQRETATAHQYTCHRSAIVRFLREHFGHLAQHKMLPGWVLSLPESDRRELLESYLAGDGWTNGHLNEISTVSKSLAFGIKSLAQSLGHTASVYVIEQNGGGTIDGRTIKPNFPCWRVKWRNDPSPAHSQTTRDELHEWCPVREIDADGREETVYNISVMEDESYVVEGIVVHNCKHFSKAKGGRPVSEKIRGLAWVVIRWAKAVKPRVIILENVEEFKDWGPVTADGQPCPLRKGLTFRRWRSQLENLGYRVGMRELRASDYGAPTIRKRLFIVARCDDMPIRWPEPTHGDPKKITQDLFTVTLKPWRTAAECIDWSIPCPSIFERERPLAENTLRRIATGIRRFVIEAKEPFIVNLTHHGGDRVESLDEPFKTITGANRGEKALCTPFLAGVGGRAGQSPERSPDQPYQTVTAKADGAIICPTLIQTGYGERDGQAPRVPGLDKPLGTVVAGAAKHALVTPVLVGAGGPARAGEPRPLDRPIGTQTTRNNTHLVTPLLVGTGGPAYSAKPRHAGQPMHTMTTDSRAALVSAFLAKHYGGVVGSDLPEPMGTVTATDHHSLVTSHLLKLYGTCKDGQPVTEPVSTIRAEGTHLAEVRAFLIKYFGTDQDPRLDEPLHTITSKHRFGLVTVQGQDYVIADIGLRMLTPPELYRAQGFPEHYLISPVIDGKPLSKTAQVRMCGNSVCPPIAAAVARAQFQFAPVVAAA